MAKTHSEYDVYFPLSPLLPSFPWGNWCLCNCLIIQEISTLTSVIVLTIYFADVRERERERERESAVLPAPSYLDISAQIISKIDTAD